MPPGLSASQQGHASRTVGSVGLASLLAAGLFLTVAGLIALSFGLYTLMRGGRGQRGGISPFSERGVHVIAGVRMTLISTLSLVADSYLLWTAL